MRILYHYADKYAKAKKARSRELRETAEKIMRARNEENDLMREGFKKEADERRAANNNGFYNDDNFHTFIDNEA